MTRYLCVDPSHTLGGEPAAIDLTAQVRLEREFLPRESAYLADSGDVIRRVNDLGEVDGALRAAAVRRILTGTTTPLDAPVVLVAGDRTERVPGLYEMDELRRSERLGGVPARSVRPDESGPRRLGGSRGAARSAAALATGRLHGAARSRPHRAVSTHQPHGGDGVDPGGPVGRGDRVAAGRLPRARTRDPARRSRRRDRFARRRDPCHALVRFARHRRVAPSLARDRGVSRRHRRTADAPPGRSSRAPARPSPSRCSARRPSGNDVVLDGAASKEAVMPFPARRAERGLQIALLAAAADRGRRAHHHLDLRRARARGAGDPRVARPVGDPGRRRDGGRGWWRWRRGRTPRATPTTRSCCAATTRAASTCCGTPRWPPPCCSPSRSPPAWSRRSWRPRRRCRRPRSRSTPAARW